MFGGKKRKTTNEVTQALQPLIHTLESTTGLPRGFWEDAYVLGFMTGSIAATLAMFASRDKLGDDLGNVFTAVFDGLAGGGGKDIMKRARLFDDEQNRDFLRGTRNAHKVISVTFGLPGYEDDPDVIRAREMSAALEPMMSFTFGHTPEASAVGGTLQKKLFLDVVRQRLRSERV